MNIGWLTKKSAVAESSEEMMEAEAAEQLEPVFSATNVKNYIGICVLNIFIRGLAHILITSYFSYFYTIYLGISPEIIAVVLSTGIILDGVSDFAMGAILDKVYTKHGKAKHWVIWMAVPLAVTEGLMFLAPEGASLFVKVAYAFIMYNLYCCAMTAVRLPSQAICSLCSSNDKVRTIYAWCSSAGSTLAKSVTAFLLVRMLQRLGGESAYAYRVILVIFAIATGIATLLCGCLFHEQYDGEFWRRQREINRAEGRKTGILTSFGQIIQNKYWVIYFVFHFFEMSISGIFNGSMAYFCRYVLGDSATAAILLTITSWPMLAGQIFNLPLFRIMDATRVALIGFNLTFVGCFLGKMFGVSSMGMLCFALAIRSFGQGMVNGCRGGLMPRIVDYGEWKTGVRQDGMGYGGTSVFDKISSALITLLIGAVLTHTGFTDGSAVSELTVRAIQFVFLDLSLVCSVISLGVYLFFDLDKTRMKKIRRDIRKRHREQGIEEPCEHREKETRHHKAK